MKRTQRRLYRYPPIFSLLSLILCFCLSKIATSMAFNNSKVATISSDALFSFIERSQISSQKSFGRILDAGTGSHSLRWIAELIAAENLPLKYSKYLRILSYTAVTADTVMQKTVKNKAEELGIAHRGDVVLGNWFDRKSLGVNPDNPIVGNIYDTILVDYLIGAMDGFSPFYQDMIIPRLAHYLKPGGQMYIVGLEPIPDKVEGDANIFCRVTKLRDACILLANHRCYREYPLEWIKRQVKNEESLSVKEISKFPIMYSHETITRQLNVARSKLPLFESKELAKVMGAKIDAMEMESKEATDRSPNGRLKIGFDYIVVAEKRIISDKKKLESCKSIEI